MIAIRTSLELSFLVTDLGSRLGKFTDKSWFCQDSFIVETKNKHTLLRQHLLVLQIQIKNIHPVFCQSLVIENYYFFNYYFLRTLTNVDIMFQCLKQHNLLNSVYMSVSLLGPFKNFLFYFALNREDFCCKLRTWLTSCNE